MRAVVFDFNGTVSDDEPVLARIYQELFAELGRPMTPDEYFEQPRGPYGRGDVHSLARTASRR